MTDKFIGPQLPSSTNKFGLPISALSPKAPTKSMPKIVCGLVPYGDDDGNTSEEEEDPKEKKCTAASAATNGHAPSPAARGAVANLGTGAAFVPRSVTINALKSQEPRPATPNTLAATAKAFQELRHSNTNPGSAPGGGMMTSTSGQWKVTDQETHNPSVDSNNSTGSTSSWKITPASQATTSKKSI